MKDTITYLRVRFKILPDKTAQMITSGDYKPCFIKKAIPDNDSHPIQTIIIGMESSPYILKYEEVTIFENYDFYHDHFVIPENTKKRIMKYISEWMDKNWQELPSH